MLRTCLLAFLLLLAGPLVVPQLGGVAEAHGGEPPPPPEDDDPPEDPPPPTPPPPVPRAPTPQPPLPGPPTTPPDDGGGPPAPPAPRRPNQGKAKQPTISPRRRNKTSGGDQWRLWWGYNREALVGMRGRLRDAVTVSGGGENVTASPLGKREKEIRELLRWVIANDPKPSVRAAALIALGRMGRDEDVRTILGLLHDSKTKPVVREAAAVALAILPPLEDKELRDATRAWLTYAIGAPRTRPTTMLTARERGLCLIAAGLRARNDSLLVMRLSGRAAASGFSSDEAGTLAYALGLSGNAMGAPELLRGARKKKLGGEPLSDVGRAHALHGLAFIGDSSACRTLMAVLISRRAGEHSRRSAALGLGRLTGARQLSPELRDLVRKALGRALENDKDILVRGFAAAALGNLRGSESLAILDRNLRKGGRPTLRPFIAIGIGLWALNAKGASRTRAQEVVHRELTLARDRQVVAALCIAVGLARARSARDDLLAILKHRARGADVRGAAAEGLGLMNARDPEVVGELRRILRQGKQGDLLKDAALALGLLGQRGAAGELAGALRNTRSTVVQARIIIALGHLGHAGAISPMVAILKDRSESTLVREFAAVALGLMGDRRIKDPLFELDAWFNFHATTRATNEFLRLY